MSPRPAATGATGGSELRSTILECSAGFHQGRVQHSVMDLQSRAS